MLRIKDLHAQVNDTQVLKGVNLNVNAGEVHAIMGPNGSGKSTLSKVIAGHPGYEVAQGQAEYEVNFQYKDLLNLEPDERAREGVFLAFQYPIEVPGVTNINFLRTAFNSICKSQGIEEMSEQAFSKLVAEKARKLDMDPGFLNRPVNEGFSGGEKKRNEILQMATLSPRLAFLDETDSGLDIDSLKVVADGVNALRSSDNAIVMITHYQRILDYIEPDYVHVFVDGRIVKSGEKDLARQLEEKGYDGLTPATAQG